MRSGPCSAFLLRRAVAFRLLTVPGLPRTMSASPGSGAFGSAFRGMGSPCAPVGPGSFLWRHYIYVYPASGTAKSILILQGVRVVYPGKSRDFGGISGRPRARARDRPGSRARAEPVPGMMAFQAQSRAPGKKAAQARARDGSSLCGPPDWCAAARLGQWDPPNEQGRPNASTWVG